MEKEMFNFELVGSVATGKRGHDVDFRTYDFAPTETPTIEACALAVREKGRVYSHEEGDLFFALDLDRCRDSLVTNRAHLKWDREGWVYQSHEHRLPAIPGVRPNSLLRLEGTWQE